MTQIKKDSKLIVISRRDLLPGLQAVQSSHAAIQFVYDHPEVSKKWFTISNYLIFLSVETEPDLLALVEKFKQHGLVYSTFHEPDLGNALTAVAVEPSDKARKKVSGLPLMLKEFNSNK